MTHHALLNDSWNFGLICEADFEVEEYTKTTSNTDENTKLLNRNLF
jgi:hypothetical protein